MSHLTGRDHIFSASTPRKDHSRCRCGATMDHEYNKERKVDYYSCPQCHTFKAVTRQSHDSKAIVHGGVGAGQKVNRWV